MLALCMESNNVSIIVMGSFVLECGLVLQSPWGSRFLCLTLTGPRPPRDRRFPDVFGFLVAIATMPGFCDGEPCACGLRLCIFVWWLVLGRLEGRSSTTGSRRRVFRGSISGDWARR